MIISPEISRLIDAVKNDRTHGASELARQAADVLKVAAKHSRSNSVEWFLREQKEVAQQLMRARPAMAPVFNIVNILLSAVVSQAAEMDLDKLKLFTVSRADEMVMDSIRAVAQIAEHGARLISDGDRIMTHSYSSTIVAVLKKAFDRYGNISVITTRSGTGGSGTITAGELGRYGIPVTFIDDTAIGLYVSSVNKVIIGADRICADGKVVNGVGSYQLAIAAEKTKVPFYVLCERLKFDPRLKGEDVDLEEGEPSELVGTGRLPPEVKVKNPHFDITPPELVTGILTEKGLLSPEQAIDYLKTSPAG